VDRRSFPKPQESVNESAVVGALKKEKGEIPSQRGKGLSKTREKLDSENQARSETIVGWVRKPNLEDSA